jgi:hypothetical protein
MAESGAGQPKRMTLESGPMAFHYILSNNVAFLTLADKVGWWRHTLTGCGQQRRHAHVGAGISRAYAPQGYKRLGGTTTL